MDYPYWPDPSRGPFRVMRARGVEKCVVADAKVEQYDMSSAAVRPLRLNPYQAVIFVNLFVHFVQSFTLVSNL